MNLRHPQSFKKNSLRNVLIAFFIIEIVVTVGLVQYLFYKNEQDTVEKLANISMEEVGKRVEIYLDNYLKTAHLVNQLNADAVRLGELNLENRREIVNHLLTKLLEFNSISGLHFGNERGDFLIAARDYQELTILESDLDDVTILYRYLADTNGKKIKLLKTFKNMDVRQRPWYEAAKKTDKKGWSPIYSLMDIEQFAITAYTPIYDKKTGDFIGAFSVNLNLAELSKFLGNLEISDAGEVFIVEPSGKLVASSADNPNKEIKRKEKIFVRKYPRESGNQLIRNTAEYLQKNRELYCFECGDKNLKYYNDRGEAIFVRTIAYKDEYGIDWNIAIVVPKSDFTAEIDANTQKTIILGILALLVSLGVGIITAGWVTKPILKLNEVTKDIASGELERKLEINRSDEVGELAASFRTIVAQLQESFQALKESENKLAKFLDAVPVGVSVIDASGEVLLVNRAGQEILGDRSYLKLSSTETSTTYQLYLVDTDEIYPAERMPTLRGLRGETAYIDDMEIRRSDGKIIPLEVRTIPVFDAEGNVSYAINAFVDIGERLAARQMMENYNRTLEAEIAERTAQLAEAKKAAEAANKAKSIFIANMSHELRTPLNTILGFCEMLAQSEGLNREQQENLSIIASSGEHLLSLINQVLDLSKIEADRLTLNENNFALHDFLDNIENLFKLKASQKGLDLIIDYPENLPRYVRTDEMKLRQVLINLINNAVKFTFSGQVILRVALAGCQSPGPSESLGEARCLSATQLEFELEDTGSGIAPEELEHLFRAFAQTACGRQMQEGSGLGLVISRRFVELMGGDITVSSKLGRGTIFKFNISVNLVDEQELESKKLTSRVVGLASKQPQFKILIVDDQELNRLLLVRLLRPLGFQLQEAANGREALTVWQEWEPDLIFMDLRMPVMDGHEATQQIRASRPGQSCVIIAVTANVLEEEKAVALSAGWDDLIKKPFRHSQVWQMLEQHLGVEFIYEEISPTKAVRVEETGDNFLTAEAFMAPPDDVLESLRNALIIGDLEEVAEGINALAIYAPALAENLKPLAASFNYVEILRLIGN